MSEYILEFGDALYNEETGEAVFNPTYKGELIRCWKCKHWCKEKGLCTHPKVFKGHEYILNCDEGFYCGYAERKKE